MATNKKPAIQKKTTPQNKPAPASPGTSAEATGTGAAPAAPASNASATETGSSVSASQGTPPTGGASENNQGIPPAGSTSETEVTVTHLLVRSLVPGFRRGGRAWPAEEVKVSVDDLTAEQIEQIMAEPLLNVMPVAE